MAENKDIQKYSSLGVMGKPNGKKFTSLLGRSKYMYQEIDIDAIDKAVKEEEERAEAAELALDTALKNEIARAEGEETTLYDLTYILRKCLSEEADWDELLELFRNKAEGYQSLEQLIDTVYNFINNTDPDGMIDTFKELENFLKGLDESYTLADMFKALKAELTTETERAEATEKDLLDLLDTEVSRAEEAEKKLADDLQEESDRATEREHEIEQKLKEVAQSTANDIEAEKERAEKAEEDLQTAIDAETKQREEDVTTLTNNLQAEVDRATSEEARLEALINADEQQLEDELNEEIERATTAEQTLQNNIDTEAARAKEAEETLQTNIDNLETELKSYYVGEDAIKVNNEGTISLKLKDGELFLINEDDGLSMNLNLIKETEVPEANVLEAYKLVDKDGIQVGARIDIYKDALLLDVYLKDLQLTFEYELADGSTKIVEIPVHDFLYQAEFADGLQFSSDGIVSVKIDPRSEGYLTVSEDGVKFTGLDDTKDRVTNLESELAQEIANRELADKDLQATLEKELSDANDTLTLAIADETARATKAEEDLSLALTDAEDSLTKAIGEEQTRAEAAEQLLTDDLDAESSRAKLAEEGLKSELDQDVADINETITTEVNTLTVNLNAEITRAEQAESDLSDALSTALTNLQNAIDEEASRAESAEATLQTNIDTVQSNLDEAVSTLESELNNAVDGLDVSDTAVAGLVVISVSEANGKIAVTRASITSTDASITLNDGSDGGIDISIPAMSTSEVEEIFNAAWAV